MKNLNPEISLNFYNFHGDWKELIFVVQLLTRQDEYILFSVKMYTSGDCLYLRFMQNYSTSTIRLWPLFLNYFIFT
jgi:hypothetical protein